ncbi:hypothetical protein ACFQX6_05695 [Streptosporangium lutulentum]
MEVEALNADPTPIERLTVPAIIESLEKLIDGLDRQPILMGHSAAASSPRSSSTAATAPSASPSTPPPPKASRSSPCHRSEPPSPC